MPTFAYHARSRAGQSVTGTYQASDVDRAAQELRDQGFWITDIRAVRETAPAGVVWEDILLGGANPRALALFYRQLAAAVNAGMSVARSVELASVGAGGRLRGALDAARRRTADGAPLSDALRPRQAFFGRVAVALIRAGEQSGHLEAMLRRCADHFERLWSLQQRTRRAMVYPAILLIAAIVIPALPAFVLQGPAVAFRTALLPQLRLLVEVVAALFLFRALVRLDGPGRVWDALILPIPLIGTNVRKTAFARFFRSFADLYDAGIGPGQALDVAADTCGNRAVGGGLRRARAGIESGVPLSQAFAATGLLPTLAHQMLVTGETSGAIPESLHKVADFLEADVEHATESWMRAMPLLLWLVVAIPMILQIVHFWQGYGQNLTHIMDENP